MTQGQFLVPGKIDFKLIFDSVGYSDQYYNDHVDKYNYVIHKIIEGRVFNRQINSSFGYTQLNFQVLRNFFGRKYASKVLNDLKEWKIIGCDNHFITGIKSYGYRIMSAWKSKAVLRNIHKEEVWKRKLAKQHAEYVKTITNTVEWDNLIQFRIRDEQAVAHINKMYDDSLALLALHQEDLEAVNHSNIFMVNPSLAIVKLSTSPVTRGTVYLMNAGDISTTLRKDKSLNMYQVLVNHVNDAHASDLMGIQMIKNEKFFLERPDATSRIYHNIANVSHQVRNFIYHVNTPNENLMNEDIRNSQPYVFNLILKEKYLNKEIPKDVANYMSLTAGGKFYEHVMALMNVTTDRAAFKVDFFGKIFFCTTHYSKRTKEGKVFEAEFPNVYKVINEYKERGYEQLAIEMQRREAGIILGVISKQLKDGGVWHSTIHDSIVVMKEHAEQVKQLILSAFIEAVGIAPSVNPEEIKPKSI